MTRRRLKGSMKSFETHINPEKEEQLEWIKIETETKVKRILKIIKSINQGSSKDGNARKKSELIQLTGDLHKEYESLYALYDNLKGEIKRIRDEDGMSSYSSSPSSSDSEQFYSPQALILSDGSSNDVQKKRNGFDQKSETSDVEDAVLKDKLTCSIEVKETRTLKSSPSFSQVPDAGEVIKDIGMKDEQSTSMTQKLLDETEWLKNKLNEKEGALLSQTKKHQQHQSERLAQIKELESQVAELKHELETLSTKKRESKQSTEFKSREVKESEEEVSKLQAQVQKLRSESQKKEKRFLALRKKHEENELHMASKIEGLMKKGNELQQELDSLSKERSTLKDQLCSKTQDGDARVKGLTKEFNFLQQKLESVSTRNGELELELDKKSQEVSECNIQIKDLKDKVNGHEMEATEDKEGLKVQLKDLEAEVKSLCSQKTDLEEQMTCANHELHQSKVEQKELHTKISELHATLAKREDELSAIQKEYEAHRRDTSIQKGLKVQLSDLESEVNSLSSQKSDLQEQMTSVNHDLHQSKVEQKELHTKISELHATLMKREDELSAIQKEYEALRSDTSIKKGLKVQLSDLESEVNSLSSQKSDLQEQMTSVNHDLHQSKVEQKELHTKISELHATLMKREDELSALQKEYEAHRSDTSSQITSLQSQISNLEHEQNRKTSLAEESLRQLQLESEKESSHSLTELEKRNSELIEKVADQQRTITGLEDVVSNLREENKQTETKLVEFKSSFQAGERKIDEMAKEIRKQFEDNLRILSRRINVAEQLQVENKEWCKRTRDTYTVENKDLKERVEQYSVGLRNLKEISVTANAMLASLDAVALKYEECTANFMNRISKVSCELKSANDWVMRKSKAVSHIKDDLDCLLVQLDEKEAEILAYREKVWESENKAREMEKIAEDKEECMLGLMEEKREAIRQLCVWIDFHRRRSDYYKKTLTDMADGCRNTA